jgi:hypothetical protein
MPITAAFKQRYFKFLTMITSSLLRARTKALRHRDSNLIKTQITSWRVAIQLWCQHSIGRKAFRIYRPTKQAPKLQNLCDEIQVKATPTPILILTNSECSIGLNEKYGALSLKFAASNF